VRTSVLIVDDDDGIRQVLRLILEDEGYAVYEAPDGKPALERLRNHPEGIVVLLDLNMPGVDGFDVMRSVSLHTPLTTRHAYIVMTAGGRTIPLAFAQHLVRLSIPVLTKPLELDQLLEEVARAAKRLDKAE
jgi:CheY-like chemotaxis protein